MSMCVIAMCLYNKNKTSPSVTFIDLSDIYGHISCGNILGHEQGCSKVPLLSCLRGCAFVFLSFIHVRTGYSYTLDVP